MRGTSDTEVLLWSYIMWGEECVTYLNGIYAFAIYDDLEKTLFCARDRQGVKPFYFTQKGNCFYFASEEKALLAHPDVKADVDRVGLWQLLFLSPVTLEDRSVYRDIEKLLPGECCLISERGLKRWKYWTLTAEPHTETREETIDHVKWLLTDAIQRQLVSDVPLSCFLSGGLDSSIVSAVAAKSYEKEGRTLHTYSFAYEGNEYAPTLFQPNADDEYAIYMADYIGSHHHVLTASSKEVADHLIPATQVRDFPGQADIDSSLLYFCGEVKKLHTVALSGECADEIFGGYPWFYRPEMLYRDFFPWLHNPMARVGLFREEIVKPKEGYEYLSGVYRDVVKSAPLVGGEPEEDRTARIATVLSTRYFMASLLERKDRMSMAHGLEVRVPFSDHRILEYVYNVPWKIKFENQTEKGLLRNAMAEYLPDKILHRKKSPYPKTHNPAYESMVREALLHRLRGKNSPLAQILKKGAVESLMAGGDVTWLGQLMSRPQLLAWLLQADFWLSRVNLTF
jgi:asparagine synthase (glutamine-hydrolysing)